MSSSSSPTSTEFKKGSIVSLHGLVRAKHLNGRDGIVISAFDRKTQERVTVRIVPLGDEKVSVSQNCMTCELNCRCMLICV